MVLIHPFHCTLVSILSNHTIDLLLFVFDWYISQCIQLDTLEYNTNCVPGEMHLCWRAGIMIST